MYQGTAKLSFLSVAVASLLPGVCIAGELPTKIFGVGLGDLYGVGADGMTLEGMQGEAKAYQKFLGSGFHVYFKPNREYSDFAYKEYKSDNPDFPTTSFHLYVLPVLPEPVDLQSPVSNVRVSGINWSTISDSAVCNEECKKENYWKVRKLCDVYSADLDLKPEIIDTQYGQDGPSEIFPWRYHCEFVGDDRVFNLESHGDFINVELSYTQEVWDKMNDEIEAAINRAYAKENKPYQ